MPPSTHPVRRRVLLWSAGIAGAVFAALLIAAYLFLPGTKTVRQRVESTLSDYFGADVSLGELHISLFPHLGVEGGNLTLKQRHGKDGPPLLQVGHFKASAAWSEVLIRPRRIRRLDVQGLRITIAPKPNDDGVRSSETGGCQGNRQHSIDASARARKADTGIVIAVFTAPDTELTLLPRNPKKLPRKFTIHSLTIDHLTLDRPLTFDAVLTNPTPRGLISAKGQFGPWVAENPGLAPVKGEYVFANADLNTIGGIGGTLSSKGSFDGLLQQILVKGTADVPDFSLDTGGHPMPLSTSFDACVDGTDGDTYLDRVDAKLASTPIHASGKVEGTVGANGRTVKLDVRIDRGRIEDLLHLAVKSDQPLMKGEISLNTAFLLPPGKGEVVERLRLDGTFGLQQTRFTSGGVQKKIDELSRRGRGEPQSEAANVASNFRGRFKLGDGVLQLPQISFEIPGAHVQLRGNYGLVTERMSFRGTVRLHAKVSQMTTGFKSMLLKMVDPLFKGRNAGTELPIHIEGTREHPKFGVDVKQAILH